MNRDQAELIRRIREFQFDDPLEARPFSKRLAQEREWTALYTARAIEEYRRFVALAMVADQPVCPSKHVDDVWHLHLIYTRSYWQRFCGDVLRRPLHHEPSRGGAGELTKHREMYARTLDEYRRVFGMEPPLDIWPPVDVRFAPTDGEVTIERSGSNPSRWRRLSIAWKWPLVAIVGAVVPWTPLINPPLALANVNPLELHGPDFLLFYAVSFCMALGLAILLRYWARHELPPMDSRSAQLDAYQTAYLAGGRRAATNTAVAQLVRKGQLILLATSPPRFRQAEAPNADMHSFEKRVFDRFGKDHTGDPLRVVHQEGETLCEPLSDRLCESGLIVSRRARVLGVVLPLLMMGALLSFGIAKVIVGIARGRPVAYLVLACLATAIIALIAFGRRLHRTPSGDRELAALRDRLAYLRRKFGKQNYSEATLDTNDQQFPLALGLFGIGLLATTPLDGLATALDHRGSKSGSGSYGSSCTTGGGCGGGGASCGGGGGGGGCGGGGCGGCSG